MKILKNRYYLTVAIIAVLCLAMKCFAYVVSTMNKGFGMALVKFKIFKRIVENCTDIIIPVLIVGIVVLLITGMKKSGKKINRYYLTSLIFGGVTVIIPGIFYGLNGIYETMKFGPAKRSLGTFLESGADTAGILIRLLIVGIVVLLFLGSKNSRKYEGKWADFVTCATMAMAVVYASYTQLRLEVEATTLMTLAGYIFISAALLNKKLWKVSVAGFGLMALTRIMPIFEIKIRNLGRFIGYNLHLILGFVAFAIFAVLAIKKIKILRTVAVIALVLEFIIISNEQSIVLTDLIELVMFIVLAMLMVPKKAGKLNFTKIVSLLFVALGIIGIMLWKSGRLNGLFVILIVLASVLLAIAFMRTKKGILAQIGFGIYAVAFATDILSYVNIATAIDTLGYNIADILTIAAMTLLITILGSDNRERNIRFRKATIALATVAFIWSVVIMPYMYRGFGRYRYFESIVSLNNLFLLLFFVTIVCATMILVPFKFTKYCNVGKHLFLSVITLGVWHFIWIYNVTANLNAVEGTEKRNATDELLLCMFLPLYMLYWNYKTASCIDKCAENVGEKSHLAIPAFFTGIIAPFLATSLMQNKINEIVGKETDIVLA